MDTKSRVVVVGGGVAGAATAFALASAGADVVVVDGAHEGQATAAGAGIIQPWSSRATGPMYDLYAAGAAYYPELVARLGECGVTELGYRVSGSLVVDRDDSVLDEIERRVRQRTADVPVAGTIARLDSATARALFPPLASGLGGLHIAGGARVDGRLLLAGLLAGAQHLGARVEHAQARIAVRAGRCVVDVGGREFDADAVVVAAGAWTDNLLAPLDVQTRVAPQRGQIAHLRLREVDTAGWPTIVPQASHYLVCFGDGHIAAGATRETGSGFDSRVTAAGVRDVLSNALDLAPGLAAATLTEVRVGLRPLGDDLPSLGAVPGVPGLFVNTGFGAAGLTMAPAAGAALAQVILHGSSGFDLAPYAPARR